MPMIYGRRYGRNKGHGRRSTRLRAPETAMSELSFAQMVQIWELRARGMNAEAIAERLGLAVEDVQSVLNPPPRATP